MPAPRNLSAKDKARLDEQRILEDLRNEGLIATSKFEARSGMAFEVVEASQQLQLRRALPARLAKLNKKKKREKTKEEIAAKLEKAERRRKVSQLGVFVFTYFWNHNLSTKYKTCEQNQIGFTTHFVTLCQPFKSFFT